MRIGSITPFSLLDFPGRSSCVIFTLGCNFRCGYCHNPDFVLPNRIQANEKYIIGEGTFFSFLEKRKGLLDGVSICGGEPTLQKDLYDFCSRVKQMGFLVKLDTNGRDPLILRRLIRDRLVDYIAMDLKHSLEKLEDFIEISVDKESYRQSIEILLEGEVEYEFRTTCIKNHHTLEDIESIMQSIKGAKRYFLQNYRSGDTLQKNFDGFPFLEAELQELQTIGHKYIEKCGIRI